MIDCSWEELYEAFYPTGTRAREILEKHSRSVAQLAIEFNERLTPRFDTEQVVLAYMLHDIGIFLTNAPSIDCHGCQPYLRHGILGADLLRRHGYPEYLARVAERHTGSGLTHTQALALGINVPESRILYPDTTLERLICYADKFYSKTGTMQRKPLNKVRASLARFGSDALSRFDDLLAQFGEPSE